jgi:hypothetical protein
MAIKIRGALANINSMTVASLKPVNAAIFYQAFGHTIKVDRVRVRRVVSRKGTTLNDSHYFF